MREGGLSYKRFCVEAKLLQKRSHELASRQEVGKDKCVATWEWRHGHRQHLAGNSYLVSTGNLSQNRSAEIVDGMMGFDEQGGTNIEELVLSEEETDVEVEDLQTTLLQCEDVKTSLLEFHIVYHTIYQTPVLYFRALAFDGTPLNSDAVTESVLLPGSNDCLKLAAIEEHPVLGKPFSFIHPCETAAAMQLLQAQLQPDKTLYDPDMPWYLASWLSLVEPLTGISPLDYYAIR